MKRIFLIAGMSLSFNVFAWTLAGLPAYQSYQNQTVPQQPQPSYSQQYNTGYNDGYMNSHGYAAQNGYGPAYQDGYNAAWKAEHRQRRSGKRCFSVLGPAQSSTCSTCSTNSLARSDRQMRSFSELSSYSSIMVSG
ncbi:exported hypothetical protein [Paraburkholderia ribeironis]|uniref:Uncharacterized protein n=1 Tax=Paraburkholderia ribeironis TaxID=1247936 RepID=A0A1N7RJJ9_9BURK|nr:hypothetical protein [Paraburkholderia ribeironis]SIT35286.1 exported hypothetical protein [Paraburkholderia ribeironis]